MKTIFVAMSAPSAQLDWAIALSTALALALLFLVHKFLELKDRFEESEIELLERTIGTHSRNWTATALNLEKKAQEPGEVARSSALTYLHLLDEAAEAWLKGSQWQDALRVTQQLLIECSHTIGTPGFGENEFRAAADLIENRMATYADLSRAASEAPENGLRFLHELDQMLSVTDQSPRIVQLRDMFETTSITIETGVPPLKKQAQAKAS